MSVTGSNLLNRAFNLIAQNPVIYRAAASRAINAIGNDITSYAPDVTITGSVQAVNRAVYHQFGFDLEKNYISFFTSNSVIDLARDVSGDMIIFFGVTYQLISVTRWFDVDGWVECKGVQVS